MHISYSAFVLFRGLELAQPSQDKVDGSLNL